MSISLKMLQKLKYLLRVGFSSWSRRVDVV